MLLHRVPVRSLDIRSCGWLLPSGKPTLAPCINRQLTARALFANEAWTRGVPAEYQPDVARILEQALRASETWKVVATDFYPPPVVSLAKEAMQNFVDIEGVAWGGYPQAERCRVLVGDRQLLAPYLDAPDLSAAVAILEVKGNFIFDPATHRDFLGACLGTGIDRSKVGDIIIQGDRGAQLLVAPSLVEHLEQSLTQVRSVPVETREVSLESLEVREAKVQEMTSVEASMRLDAVGSAGFRMSRSRLSDLINKGDVRGWSNTVSAVHVIRVNWRPVTKGSLAVKQGDVISCRGMGRVEIKEVQETKKGKYAVSMVRYV